MIGVYTSVAMPHLCAAGRLANRSSARRTDSVWALGLNNRLPSETTAGITRVRSWQGAKYGSEDHTRPHDGATAWLTEAMALIRQKPDLMTQMRNCMDGYGDVRVVFHVRENATTVEVVDSSTVLGVLSPSLSPKTVASRC